MGLEEIKAKIIEEAKIEAEKIKKAADEEASRIEADAGTQADRLSNMILQEAKARAEAERLARLVPSRLAARKKLLEEKHKILNEVFAGCSAEIKEAKEIEVAKFLYG